MLSALMLRFRCRRRRRRCCCCQKPHVVHGWKKGREGREEGRSEGRRRISLFVKQEPRSYADIQGKRGGQDRKKVK